MKTFKTRSGAMKHVNKSIKSMDNSCAITSISPPSYTLYLDKINDCDDCERLTPDQIGYLYYNSADLNTTMDINIFNYPDCFTKDSKPFNDYDKITKVNILNEITYSITYNPEKSGEAFITYTINENKDEVFNKMLSLSKTNSSQVIIQEINDTPFVDIFTYKRIGIVIPS